ncbi:MAG TPA: DUF2723 domain-containing protein [Candidatus Binatia bacterium]|nr:DUF2723 domain-containing protein [Candidatus Binatia bacterium]
MSRHVDGSRIAHLGTAAGPIGLGLLAVAVYRTTLLPGVGWWDTAEFQTVGPLLGTAHPTGYPSYVVLGWLASAVLAPVGEPAVRMNLLSAILVAVAVAGTAVAATILTGRSWLGLVAGAGLALTPGVWAISTAADPHALHLALVAGLLVVLLRWEVLVRQGEPSAERWLFAAAGLGGVAVGNHGLTVLLAPWLVVFVLVVDPGLLRRPRLLAACLGLGVAVAGALYLELPLRAGPFRAPLVYGHPERLDGFLAVVLGSQFAGAVRSPVGDPAGVGAAIAAAMTAEFGPLAVLLPVAVLTTVLRRSSFALLSLPAAALTAVFAASYENAEIGRYYLGPVLFGWLWLAVLGDFAAERLEPLLAAGSAPGPGGRRAPVVATPMAALVAALLLGPVLVAAPATRAAVDRSDDTSAARWLDAVLPVLAPDAVVVSWWSVSTPLWYAQLVEGRRPDVWVVDDRTRLDADLGEVTDVIDANLRERPVYVIRASAVELAALAAAYELEPLAVPVDDPPWRVLRPRTAGGSTAPQAGDRPW